MRQFWGLGHEAMSVAALGIAIGFGLTTSGQAADADSIRSHGISTFGDLKYAADFSYLDYVNPDAPKGGEISIWAQGTFDSMNPYSEKGRAGRLSSIQFESLLTGTADEVSSSYGLLAAEIEYPEDRSWAIFDLRPEARFSDGTPVLADDVEFSYQQFLENGLISFRRELERAVSSVVVENPHRIRFNFNTAESTRRYPALVGGLPIFSKTWFTANNANLAESSMTPPIGSGPYLVDRIDVNERIIYRRNPDYWGAHLPINRGRSNFDSIRVEYFADSNAALEGFKAGTYSFRQENVSKTWATGYDFPAVENGEIVKRRYPDGTNASGQSFVFNLRRDRFADPRVREAIGLMFNFEWSNSTLFFDAYARIHSFWENSDLAASGQPGEAELALLEPLRDQIDASVFAEPAVMAPVSEQNQLDRNNLRKAADLLAAAGWQVDSEGLRIDNSGRRLELEILTASPAFDRVVLPYVENLRRLGVDARMSRVDYAQYTDRRRNHNFDMIIDSFPMSLEPGNGLRQYFGSQNTDGVFNSPGISDPAVDALIEHVILAENRQELKIAVRALDRVLRAERFWVPQWFRDSYTVAYQDIYDHPQTLPPYSLGHLDFWWAKVE